MEFVILMAATATLYAGAYFLGKWIATVQTNKRFGPEWVERGARDAKVYGGSYHFDSGTPWIQKFYDQGFYAKLAEKEEAHV